MHIYFLDLGHCLESELNQILALSGCQKFIAFAMCLVEAEQNLTTVLKRMILKTKIDRSYLLSCYNER